MKKLIRYGGILLLAAVAVWMGSVVKDRQVLRREVIRLHVVAASDRDEDQALKLQVRDTVVESLEEAMAEISGAQEAKEYLRENLAEIEDAANRVLAEAGCEDRAKVTLGEEEFDTRYYDTFTLPAGVYESLRITIGAGGGHNWWCVVFPTLCLPATSEGFEEAAGEAGFDDALTCALTGEAGYELRFYFLDVLGKLENMLHGG